MKFKSSLLLTFALFAGMIGIGTLSGLQGYTLGREALKSVSQPETNPTKRLSLSEENSTRRKKFELLDEREILVRVYDRVHGKDTSSQTAVETEPEEEEEEQEQSESGEETKIISSVFPLRTSDQGVALEVLDATKQGNSLLLNVSLSNEGSEELRFLYSFLEVRNEKNQALGAITEGLPGKLPANGQKFLGTVSIPMLLLDNSQKISLSLTDYPEQELQLNIPEIPVTRSR